jgi:general secretion pathway protein F
MPVFQYKVVGVDGEIHEGSMDADSRREAIEHLQSGGNTPLLIEESNKPHKTKNNFLKIFFNKNNITNNDITLFTSELATILQAGLELDHALETLERLAAKPALKKMITNINQRIKSGSTFSAALEAQGTTFNSLYLNTVRGGEAGGAINVVLDRLADYLERSAELRSTVLSALYYPAILCFVALLSIFVLLSFVVPQFVPLFEDVGQALPLLTQIIFIIAEFIQSYWWVVFALFAASIWFIDRQLAIPEVRYRWDGWCLKLPLIGSLITKLDVARFSRTLGTLLSNGVPLLTAISIVKEVVVNKVLSKVIGEAAIDLERGNRLAKPLEESNLFPLLAIQLIQVGEETGQLEPMLFKVADIFEKESRATIKRILTLLEPVLILGLGAVIAVIIISILIAILGLNDLVI